MSNGARRVLLTLDMARSTSRLREWGAKMRIGARIGCLKPI